MALRTGLPPNIRSYNTCRPAKALHETSHARWNNHARSRAVAVSVARYWSTAGARGVSKSASVGSAIRLLVPSSWMISTIRGYTVRPNKVRPACRGAVAGDMPWGGASFNLKTLEHGHHTLFLS